MERASAAIAAAGAFGARYRLWIAGAMTLALAGGVIVAVRAQDLRATDLAPGALLTMFFVLTPALVATNATALMISARAVGRPMRFGIAMAATAGAAVAGLLPSGSAVTRGTVLYANGARFRDAVGLVTATAVLWVGLGFLCGAYALHAAGQPTWTVALLLGAVTTAAGVGYVVRTAGLGWAALLLASRLAALVLTGARIWVAFLAISAPIAPTDAVVFTSAATVGSAVIIVPAGLGVVEGLGALLAPLTGAPAAAAFTALALTRAVGLTFSGLLVIVVVLRHRGSAYAERPAQGQIRS